MKQELIDYKTPRDILIEKEQWDGLQEVLNTLTEREKKVLIQRFGLEDGNAKTLEKVGVEFNISGERIGQIQHKALRKLRHPARNKKLVEYFGLDKIKREDEINTKKDIYEHDIAMVYSHLHSERSERFGALDQEKEKT